MNKSKTIITISAAVAAAIAVIIIAFSVSGTDQGETPSVPTTMAPTLPATPDSAPTTAAAQTTAAQTTESPSTTEATTARPTAGGNSKIIGNFPVIKQLPELPTGCETTSLAMVLNNCGFAADKCDLADNYLEKGEFGKTDPNKAFIGDPRTEENSRGCYAPVIANAANKYLTAQGSDKKASTITGTEFKDLFSYIDKGTPVIVWGTMDCNEPEATNVWQIDGQTIQWIRPEHCTVLIGYDLDQNLIYEADPYYGEIKSYDINLFKSRYDSLYKQAVIVE